MGRLLNTLAKYVEIKGSSKQIFKTDENPDGDSSLTNKSLPSNITKNIYRSASQLHDDRTIPVPTRQQEIYDQPKPYDNISSVDRNNNNLLIPLPQPRERIRNDSENM